MRIPVINLCTVIHLGSLNAEHKASFFKNSLEGGCLSVSTCPYAWQRIARLGGAAAWELKKDNSKFLSVLDVYADKSLMEEIVAYGVENDLVKLETRWKCWSYDDESEHWRYSTHLTREDAANELYDEEDALSGGPDGNGALEPFNAVIAMPVLLERMHQSLDEKNDATDFLIMAWAEDNLPEIEGVWWQEEYDPDNLSAPRGGIFPSKVQNWQAQNCSIEDYDDEGDIRHVDYLEVVCTQDESQVFAI